MNTFGTIFQQEGAPSGPPEVRTLGSLAGLGVVGRIPPVSGITLIEAGRVFHSQVCPPGANAGFLSADPTPSKRQTTAIATT